MSAEPKILPLEPVQKTAAGGSGTYHDPAYCGKVSFEPTQLEIEYAYNFGFYTQHHS
jgi:hypothetical protein